MVDNSLTHQMIGKPPSTHCRFVKLSFGVLTFFQGDRPVSGQSRSPFLISLRKSMGNGGLTSTTRDLMAIEWEFSLEIWWDQTWMANLTYLEVCGRVNHPVTETLVFRLGSIHFGPVMEGYFLGRWNSSPLHVSLTQILLLYIYIY